MKNLKNLWANTSKKTKTTIVTAGALALVLGLVCFNSFFAGGAITQLFDTAKGFLQEIYAGLAGIVTILAVVIVGWCFCVKMFSKNPRSIEEASQWIKRVAIAWACFMLLGLFVSLGKNITSNMSGNADVNNPWNSP